jgi:hypothetical protein
MNRYIYTDKLEAPPKVVFECGAEDILEADALYRVATKKDPVKQAHVGCQVIVLDHESGKR